VPVLVFRVGVAVDEVVPVDEPVFRPIGVAEIRPAVHDGDDRVFAGLDLPRLGSIHVGVRLLMERPLVRKERIVGEDGEWPQEIVRLGELDTGNSREAANDLEDIRSVGYAKRVDTIETVARQGLLILWLSQAHREDVVDLLHVRRRYQGVESGPAGLRRKGIVWQPEFQGPCQPHQNPSGVERSERICGSIGSDRPSAHGWRPRPNR